MTHKHHIIPRHMGGSDDASNIVELTVAEHADAHNLLWCLHKNPYDKLAEKVLLGQTNPSEASKVALRMGQIKGGRARKGKKNSAEHNRNISKAMINSGVAKGRNNPAHSWAKEYTGTCLSTGEKVSGKVYDLVEMGFRSCGIRKAALGIMKTHRNHTWVLGGVS